MNFQCSRIVCEIFVFIVIYSEINYQLHALELLSTNDVLENSSEISTIPMNKIKLMNNTTVIKRIKKRRKKLVIISPTQVNSNSITDVTPKSKILLKTSKRLKRRRKIKKPLIQKSKMYKNANLESKLPILSTPTAFWNKTLRFKMKRKKTKNHHESCSRNNGECAHICSIYNGHRKCSCLKGFRLAENGHNCIDINECLHNNGDCEMNCINTLGSFKCQCAPTGYRLSLDSKHCLDINECLLRNGHGPCQDSCINTLGGYKCNCDRLKGTKLASDGHACVDIDECVDDNGGCSHICLNTFGQSFCSCPFGMDLGSDFKTCQAINQCEHETVKQLCQNGCINLDNSSFRCLTLLDVQNEQAAISDATSISMCKPLIAPAHGYFRCSKKHAIKTINDSNGKTKMQNSIGAKCKLVCSEGFIRQGNGYKVRCGSGGRWSGSLDSKCVKVLETD